MTKRKGLGKNAEIEENERGGRQSKLPYDFTLIDSDALFTLANVLYEGSKKYEIDNWRRIPTEPHLNHALAHIYAYLEGNTDDNHLGHAFCRLMMALAVKDGDGYAEDN